MRRRLTFLATFALAFALLAPVAFAHDGGQGTYGEADDKVVTNSAFLVIAFFPVLITVLSLLYNKLDRRKDARLAAKRARATHGDWHGGW
jgi:hypothetical protein